MTILRIVTRAEWGARSPKSTPTKVTLSTRMATCVHHDGPTPVVVHTFAEACLRIRADQNYHMDGQHWNDIGYNYLVISAPGYPDIDGLIFEGRGRDVVGAHCLNWNTPWIGIQVAIGGDQKPSAAALSSVRLLHDTFTAAAGHTLAKKVHSDGFNTACPGPILKAWVHSGMPVTIPIPVPPTPKPPVPVPPKPVPTPTHNVAQVKAVQKAIRVTIDGKFGSGSATAATAVIRKNKSDIKYLQARVGATQDGAWGPKSEKAWVNTIKSLQTAIHVTPDGAWGPKSTAAWAVFYKDNYGKY